MRDLTEGPCIRLAGSPIVASLSTHLQVRTSSQREVTTAPPYVLVLPSGGPEPLARDPESEVPRDACRPGWPGRRPFYVPKESTP